MGKPYITCDYCGAHLDPGERCDCTKKEGAPAGTGTPHGHETGYNNDSIARISALVNDEGRKKWR